MWCKGGSTPTVKKITFGLGLKQHYLEKMFARMARKQIIMTTRLKFKNYLASLYQ